MSNSMNPKKNRLSLMALEHRWVFDGAAPVDALHKLGSDSPLHLFDLAEATGTSPLLAQAQKDAQNTIAQWMSQPDAAHKLASIYAGGQPSEAWLQKAQGVVDAFGRGELTVRVELRSSKELNGAWGAFAGQAGGEQVIYLNADWVCTSGNTSLAVGRVLAEEWGHFLDVQLNGAVDATGDEGEAFSDAVYQINVSAQELERIATENDHLNLTIDGRVVQVEMASLLFGGQSYFAGVAPANADSTGPAGQTAQLESNTLYIGNALPGTRTLFVSDPPSAASYSGNNVRGTLYSIDASNNITASYYGEISRLIKIGSAPVSAQMYVYPDGNPTNTGGLGTTIIIDFYATAPNFSRGTIAKTSSDPVAAALNSLLPVNQAPTANPDTGFALEAGGLNNATPGSNATGNVISGSDTDPNSTYVLDLVNMKLVTQQDSLAVTKVSNASAATSATAVTTTGTTTVNGVVTATATTTIAPIAGQYGTLTMSADGTYTYAVNNDLAAVQALRGTSNTLNDVYTYTVSDGKGGFSTTTLTITVRGANDNPQAKDDYNFAKESIESTVANQYGATDAFGQKATGNVLPNDTDVDGYSETKRVAGVTASATVTTVSDSLTLNFTSVPSNVSVGRFVWLDGDGLVNTLSNGSVLRDASGNPIFVTAVTATTATLSGVPVYQSGPNQGQPIDLVPNMILGFSNNTSGASYQESRIKDAGIAPSTVFRVNAALSGQLAVGMTVSGDGVPANTTITGITYNADGTINRVTISNAIAVSGATLNFSAGSFPMTLTGQYGTLVLQENGDYVYTPFANNPALNSGDMFVDAFRYNMWDAAGAVSTATLYINVMGSGPSDPDANADTVTAIEAGGTANGTAGNNPTGNLLSNDTLGNVPSGATLSVVAVKTTETAPANASALTGSITFDGVTYAAKVTGQYGDLYVKADGTYRYVVNNTDPVVQALRLSSNQLTDTFQYKITNGSGFNWSSLTVTINGANDAPVAVNDSITAIVGEYVPVGNVLANDTDVDGGDTKTVTKIALGSTLPGSSNVTSSTTYSSGYTEIQGTYGTLRIGADGSFTYLVDANNATIKALGTGQLLASPDVFTYEMRDAAGLLSTATMTMNVEGRNDAPVNTLPATFTAQEGSSYAFTGAGNTLSASDIDNNLASTTVSVLNGTLAVSTAGSTAVMEGGVQVGVQLAGSAVLYFDRAATAGGDLTLTGNGTSNFTLYGTQAQINAALASLVYTPNVGYVGSDTLKIESIDAEGLKDVDTVSVTVAAPALTVTGTTVNEASPYTLFSVSGKEGQSIQLSLESTGTTAGHATLGTDTSLTLQYFNGSTWVTYDPTLNGGYVVMPSDGDATSGENATLLVRVANVQDTTNEGAETLKLVATNAAGLPNDTSGTNPTGISTIKDDGTGSYFAADNNTATSNVPAGVRLDDDRPLTVNSITVNEGSPYATFTVTGATGQTVLLSLANAAGDPAADATGGNAALGSSLPTLQYYNGTSWVNYDASNPPTITSGTTLLVRVPVNAEQDTALDGPETFNLVATNTGGTSGTGQATIKDDGTGSYFAYADNNTSTPLTAPAASQLDDDRPLTVNSITVNEASPYATFTVTGVAGQWVSLALGNTTATNDVDATLNTDTGNAGTSVPLQYFNGTAWVDYTPSSRVQIPAGSTTLLVRTAIVNDAGFEGPETFTLTATNTGGTDAIGTATIKDDGTGDIFKYSTTSPGTLLTPSDVGYPVLDDDRVLTVSNVEVNEGSPYAVFTVTGANGQTVKLSLDGASGDTPTEDSGGAADLGTNPALQYYEAGVWKTYEANNPPKITDGTTLLVRVAINAEQETALDGPETFRLVATNTGGTPNVSTETNPQGVATIRDDGQGDYWIGDATVKATADQLAAAKIFLDDDRITPVTISSPKVNEGSPFAVFTVSGALNQLVSLNLAPGTAGANVDFVSKLEYSPDGTTWLPYTGGNVALTGTGGTLLVRVPIINDDTLEPDETFTLTATNTGGTPSIGTATITDDGNGAYWFGDSPTPATAQQLTDAGKVLDDDRPLTIAPVTVNEASPFAVFTVTGSAGANPADQAGQLVKLNLNNVTTSGLSGLQWYDPTLLDGQPKGWTIYTPNSYVPLDSAGKLLVRVAISPEQEALQDGPETFNLVAANTGGTSTTGLGTIRDDGQGLLFSATNIDGAPENPGAAPGLPARLDDDRPLTVGNITVNEGSPKAVFTVTGAPGQVALLALGNAAAANPAGDAIGGNAALGTTLPTLQYLNASNQWLDYDENSPPVVGTDGKLLVRVSITPESDGVFDGPETFQLRATNTGNSTGVGTATVLDDGTGSYWIGDATVPATPAQLETATIKLDDDRPITVKGGTYNEGSPRAVFTVTANAGQLLTLGVEDVQTTGLASAPLSYSVDGGATWLPYTGTFVAGPVPVLVAVNITSERDEVYEVSEEFKLVVNPGLPTRAAASGFIVDDGTGAMYDAGGAAMPESAVRDDDRPRLQVTGPASPVSEGSPAVFTVTLSKTLLSSTPIDLALNPGTASAGDFAMGEVFYLDSNGNEVPLGPVGGPYAIPAGVSTFYVRALTTQDSNYEGLESLRLVATLPANVGGDSQGADAGIIDDGSGVVYTGRVDPLAGLLVDAAAIPDDDRPVAAMVDPAPAPAPAVVPPALPPSAPSLHVQFAVADARAATSGAASVASGGVMPVSPAAAGLVMQALDAQFEKFERPTDPNLFVLPAVNAARGQASEAQVPSVMQQSGLLWNERLSDGIGVGLVLVSQGIEALTLADAELARLMDEPAQQAALEVNADDAAQESERQKAHLRAARLALAQSQQDADEPVRGHTAFSRQLQQAGKRPVWMARSSRA